MIYIIWDGENYKIGRSKNPQKRLKALQTGSPKRLKLLKIFDYQSRTKTNEIIIERRIHFFLKMQKVRHNGEWFKFDNPFSLIGVVDRIIRHGFGLNENSTV